MADPATYRPVSGEIPDKPGVYRFSDAQRRVIYVGKAKSLRSRLNSYFQDLAGLHPRTQQMVTTAASVDWTVVNTEVEALQLEYTWIKEFDPRFNIRFRDDKSYPWLAVTVNEEFPRVMVMRGSRRKGVRYFGPYTHAWAIRETVDLLLRVFPMRSCSQGTFRRAQHIGRPCLLGDIGKCAAPCVGRVTPEEHLAIVDDFTTFIAGQTSTYTRRLEREMAEAAKNQEYERAAVLRDDIAALNKVLEQNAIVFGDGTDADVIALAEDPLEVAVQIFSVRDGRIRGQRGWVADKADEAGTAELVERAIVKLYEEEPPDSIPREVLVPVVPSNRGTLTEWLIETRGTQVSLRVPQRGDKRALMQTVEQNAKQALARHKTKRSGDLTTRSKALEEIQDALGLETAPLRIECYDISNLQDTEIVASMVVFEDGLPRKSEYRRFTVRLEGQNDVGSMHEVITRRFERLQRAQDSNDAAGPGIDPETGKPRRFAYAPSLVVVDGGPPQVAAAKQAMDELGITDIALCGLAKRLEEVWLPNDMDPVILPRTSEGLYLLQRIRDEAHRFAI
ncbi:MAG: excinuclease ABC subunit UvrC, partial [Aeromicrobium sp.]